MNTVYSLIKVFKTSSMPFEVYDKMNKLNGKYYDSDVASEYTVQKNKQNILDEWLIKNGAVAGEIVYLQKKK